MIDKVFEAAGKKVANQTKKKGTLDNVAEKAAVNRIKTDLGIIPNIKNTENLKNYNNNKKSVIENNLVKLYEDKNNTTVEELERKILANIPKLREIRLPSPKASPYWEFTAPYGDGNKNVTVKKSDGTEIGNVSRDAYNALMNQTLEFYQPKDENERNTLNAYVNDSEVRTFSRFLADEQKKSNPQYYNDMEYYAGIVNSAYNNRDAVTGMKKEYKEKYDELLTEYRKKAMENPWNPEYAIYISSDEEKIKTEIDKEIKKKYPTISKRMQYDETNKSIKYVFTVRQCLIILLLKILKKLLFNFPRVTNYMTSQYILILLWKMATETYTSIFHRKKYK